MNARLARFASSALALVLVLLAVSTASAQGLSISSKVSHPFLPEHTHSDIAATIRVSGGEAFGDDERAPLNLSLVVDRSTSMAGDKFEQAMAASHRLVDLLTPQDRLAIVSYGTDVTVESESVLGTPENKKVLHKVVKNLWLRGGTNLSGGYSKGVELVERHRSDQFINRVVLLSDGKANKGVVSVTGLGSLARDGLTRGVTLSTLGIGLNFNEVLMTRMAREGAGNYYFVEDEKALAEIFQREWDGLSSAVAKNAKVTIELAPGVELKKLHGYSYEARRNRVTVPLAAFFARQNKDLLLDLAVSTGALGAKKVADVRLTWRDPLNERNLSRRIELASTVTADREKLDDVDAKVLARVEQLRVSETLDRAMTEYDNGNKKKALKLLEDQRQSMNANRKKYDFDDSFVRVEGELEEMENSVKSSSSKSKEGKRLKKRARKRSYDVSQTVDLF